MSLGVRRFGCRYVVVAGMRGSVDYGDGFARPVEACSGMIGGNEYDQNNGAEVGENQHGHRYHRTCTDDTMGVSDSRLFFVQRGHSETNGEDGSSR